MSGEPVNVTALINLPNPFTPLAFLSPALSDQYEVNRYMYTITLGAYMWDLAVNLYSDYYLLFKHKIRITTVIYYISRIFTLAYVITSTVFQIGRVGNCQVLIVALAVCYLISGSSASFLFYLRVRAVYNNNEYVKAFFFVLWLSVVGGFFTVVFGIDGGHISTTSYCIQTNVKRYTGSSVIVAIINDTLVFLAISHRVLSVGSYFDDSFKSRAQSFFNSSTLPNVSRALLQGGQQYYLITVGGNIVLTFLLFSKGVPAAEHAMFTIPNIALTNAMACIVFRRIKFGLIAADGTSHIANSLTSTQNNRNFLPQFKSNIAFIAEPDGASVMQANGASMKSTTLQSIRGFGNVEIEMSNSVEHGHDPPIPLEVLHHSKKVESYEAKSGSETELPF